MQPQTAALPLLEIAAGTLSACTATSHQIKTEHLSPEWESGTFKNILVVGVYEDRAYPAAF